MGKLSTNGQRNTQLLTHLDQNSIEKLALSPENRSLVRDTKTFFSSPKTELLRIFHFGMIQVVCCRYLRRF